MTNTMQFIVVERIASVPWRNGGGRTRELFTHPAGPDWQVRISLADIDSSGPFSRFEGTTRWFAVVDGAGVSLRFGAEVHTLTPDSAPLRFDGAAAPDCDLIDGPTRDLNLMARSGTAVMQRAEAGVAWNGPHVERGLFALTAGRLFSATGMTQIEPFTLAWNLPRGACGFEPASPGRAGFWLGWSASLQQAG